jgi:hypothetical protein
LPESSVIELGHALGVAGFAGEFVHGGRIVRLAQHRLHGLDHGLEALELIHDATGLLLVIPEAGLAHLLFQFSASGNLGWQVKESPGS